MLPLPETQRLTCHRFPVGPRFKYVAMPSPLCCESYSSPKAPSELSPLPSIVFSELCNSPGPAGDTC